MVSYVRNGAIPMPCSHKSCCWLNSGHQHPRGTSFAAEPLILTGAQAAEWPNAVEGAPLTVLS